MANQSDHTTSFLVRFTQKIFRDDKGETNVQWRGKISHVQSDDQTYFSELNDALIFMQSKLSSMTLKSVDDKSEEEQKGILSKSFEMWKSLAKNSPKLVLEVIKDPKAQMNQIQEQISNVSDELSSKIELDDWRPPSRSDIHNLVDQFNEMSNELKSLTKKIDQLSEKQSK